MALNKRNFTKVTCYGNQKSGCEEIITEYDLYDGEKKIKHVGYPELHCHCKCGKVWGTH